MSEVQQGRGPYQLIARDVLVRLFNAYETSQDYIEVARMMGVKMSVERQHIQYN